MNLRQKSDLPRLWYSLFLGCIAARILFAASSADSNSWVGPTVTVVSLGLLSLPMIGAWADRITLPIRLALGVGGVLFLLTGIDYLGFFRIPFVWIGPLFAVLLVFADFFLKIQLTDGSRRLRINGAAAVLALGGVVLLVRFYSGASPELNGIVSTGLLLGSLLFLALLMPYAAVEAREGQERLAINFGGEFRSFVNDTREIGDAKTFLAFWFFLTLAATQLLFTFLRGVWTAPAWFAAAALPGVILIIAAWGAYYSGVMIANFGMKRTIRLSIVLLMLMLPAMRISETRAEATGLALFAVFLVGVLYQSGLVFYSGLLSDRHRGQGLGYHAVVMGAALGLGVMFVQRNPFEVYPVVNFILLMISLILLHPIRTGRFADSPIIQDAGREASDWEDWGQKPSPSVRHNIFSRFVQILARSLAEIFFGRLRIIGVENLRPDQGAILAANHPNTFLDPLLITAIAPGRLHYWAKSTLWKLPMLGGVLDSLGALPVYRRQDSPSRSGGNKQTLNIAAKKLEHGAHILIFPEGVSEPGLSLKPIKTGAARLGFQALEAGGWKNDIVIAPIGIDYHEPTIFRTHVTIRIGKPVSLLSYKSAYEAHPRNTVLEITETVSERLKDLLPHLEEPELETLVLRIQRLYGDQILQIMNERDETAARKAISEAVNHYQKLDPDTVYLFNQRVGAYFTEREMWSGKDDPAKPGVLEILKMLLGFFSIATYGLLVNWIPYRLTGKFAEWLTVSPVWKATAKMVLGGMIFGLYYIFVGVLFSTPLGPLSACLIVLSMILSAFIALGALNRFSFRIRRILAVFRSFWVRESNEDLETIRVGLVQDLERFRESYAFYRAKE